jgi:hypothetical protein
LQSSPPPPPVNNCKTPDGDGDGHRAIACGGDDCNDNDSSRYPGNTEVCDANGHDEDCDPTTFANAQTADGDRDFDGYQSVHCYNTFPNGGSYPSTPRARHTRDGYSFRAGGTDCDDGNAAVHDGAQICTPGGTGVKRCTWRSAAVDGWEIHACPAGRAGPGRCVAQANGTGVCVN